MISSVLHRRLRLRSDGLERTFELVKDEDPRGNPWVGQGWAVRESWWREDGAIRGRMHWAGGDKAAAESVLAELALKLEQDTEREWEVIEDRRAPTVVGVPGTVVGQEEEGTCALDLFDAGVEVAEAASSRKEVPEDLRWAIWVDRRSLEHGVLAVFTQLEGDWEQAVSVGLARVPRPSALREAGVDLVEGDSGPLCCLGSQFRVRVRHLAGEDFAHVHDQRSPWLRRIPGLGRQVEEKESRSGPKTHFGDAVFDQVEVGGWLLTETDCHRLWVDSDGDARAWEQAVGLEVPSGRSFVAAEVPGFVHHGEPETNWLGRLRGEVPDEDLGWIARAISGRGHSLDLFQL